jgi:hypothetical protein
MLVVGGGRDRIGEPKVGRTSLGELMAARMALLQTGQPPRRESSDEA